MIKPPYKAETGKWYTQALFYEIINNTAYDQRVMEPIFTLDADMPGMVNFGREYCKDMDPTGYTTAMRLLKSYPHWNTLMKAKWFREAKEQWDMEIDARIRSEAIKAIREVANDPEDKGYLNAAKYLADKGLAEKKLTRGRPSNSELDAALKAQLEEQKRIEKDQERISQIPNLKVVK